MASAGWRKKAGVPVLESVAAIFRQMMPDLPMPVTMTRPRQSSSSRTACSNVPSSRSTSARMAAASVCSTFLASAISMVTRALHRRSGRRTPLSRDGVDAFQLEHERLELVQTQRVGGIALRARGLLVDFHEHRIDAGGDAGRRQRLDVLRQAGGDAVAGARQLQAVRDVEDDGVAELAQHRKRAHVHDQVVVAEADAALGDEDRLVALGRDLGDDVPHVARRQELPLLDVDDLARARGGDDADRSAATETPESAGRPTTSAAAAACAGSWMSVRTGSPVRAFTSASVRSPRRVPGRGTTVRTSGWPCRTRP